MPTKLSRKIAVVGSRTYPVTQDWWDNVLDADGRDKVEEDCVRIIRSVLKHLTPGVTIISGGASGPDSVAVELAQDELGFDTVVIRPNWKKYGKGAGFKRNTEIVDACDDLIAFWDLESNGTWDTIKKAAKAEKDLVIFGPDGNIFFYATEEDYKGQPGLLETMFKKKQLREQALKEEHANVLPGTSNQDT